MLVQVYPLGFYSIQEEDGYVIWVDVSRKMSAGLISGHQSLIRAAWNLCWSVWGQDREDSTQEERLRNQVGVGGVVRDMLELLKMS